MKTKPKTKFKGERDAIGLFIQLTPGKSPQGLLVHYHHQEQDLPEFWLGNCDVLCSNGASDHEHFRSMGRWKVDTRCKNVGACAMSAEKMFHQLAVLMGRVCAESTLINLFIHMHLHEHKKSGSICEISWTFCACVEKKLCISDGLRESNSVVLLSLCSLM